MLRLAVPTGDLRAPTAAVLGAAGLACEAYATGSRALRLELPDEGVRLRVFREKDIPIQVGLGNYDLGICSAGWVIELESRFRRDDVVLLRPLGFGRRRLVLAAAGETLAHLGPFESWTRYAGLRIASEYPELADRAARALRLPRYTVVPVWGAAAAYPPEDAELALISIADEAELGADGLKVVATLLDASAWLIANRRSLANRDLGPALGRLLALPDGDAGTTRLELRRGTAARVPCVLVHAERSTVRLALPDGHAQRHTAAALAAAGLRFDGYDERTVVRRPRTDIAGLDVKVIRPQDMPRQVALGNFDLAVTGRDWLLDHLYQFPASPVREALDLGRSRYAIAAAVSEDVPADTLAGALAYWRRRGLGTIRVASEYPNIADHFARAHHLGRYAIVPVNGASEAFVPEDSEILIEGTETGSSFRANRLKVVERVFESTNCVISGATRPAGARGALIDDLLEQFRRGVAAVSA